MPDEEKLIVVPVEGDGGLDGRVARHLNTCTRFSVVDIESNRIVCIRIVSNRNGEKHSPTYFLKLVRKLGADTVIVWNIDERDKSFLETLGVEVVCGVSGRVFDVVWKYLDDRIHERDVWDGLFRTSTM